MFGTSIERELAQAQVNESEMHPEMALVLYRSINHKGCVEVFDIQQGLLVNPRRPEPVHLSSLLTFLQEEKQAQEKRLEGFINAETLYLQDNVMAFFQSSGIQRIFVGNTKKEMQVFLPNMVFLYTGPDHVLNAYCYTNDLHEIQPNTKCLTPAPMPNIDGDGNVCLGNSMSRVTFVSEPQEMQRKVLSCFFRSVFSEWRTELTGPILKLCETAQSDTDIWTNPLLSKWQKENPLFSLKSALVDFIK